jgi:hypothetical protein
MSDAFALAGAAGILLGAAIAALSDHFPRRRKTLQYGGGLLLVGGLTLIALVTPKI